VNRHRFDPWSFFLGGLFAALGLTVLVGGVDVTDINWSWVWPVPFIAAGLLILLSARRRVPRDPVPVREAEEPAEPTDPITPPEE
jgi:hypothetical protein